MASRLRSLASRLGTDDLAERLGVKPATVRRWLERGLPASRREEVASAYERSERSRKAAETRQREAIRVAEVRSEAARKGWEKRRLREGRDAIFERHGLVGPKGPIDGRRSENHEFLRALIEDGDDAWRQFVALHEAAGRSTKEIRSQWFSPSVKKKDKRKKRKRRKGGRR